MLATSRLGDLDISPLYGPMLTRSLAPESTKSLNAYKVVKQARQLLTKAALPSQRRKASTLQST